MRWEDRIGGRLKLRDLHVFLAVAETRSMARAAEALAVSRPVVSRAVADLERALGVALFDRLHEGVLPTRCGEELLRRGVGVFDELRLSLQAIRQLQDPGQGELRFATGESLAGGLTAAAVERLSRRVPALSIAMDVIAPGGLAAYLRDRRGELVITRVPAGGLDADLAAEPLYHERMRIVVARGSPWRRRHRPSWPDLLEAPWVLSPPELAADSPFLEALRAIGAALPRRLIVSGSLNLRTGLLPSGRFLTLMADSILRLNPLAGLVATVPVALPPWRSPVAIITLANRALSPTTLAFADEVRTIARQLE